MEMAKNWQGGSVGGRGDRVSKDPEAWHNNRDREDDEPQHSDTRLTEQERYGVQYNVDPDTLS